MYRAIAHGGKLAPYKWNAATLSELIDMLNSVGGSLWVADPQYLALNSDGSGAVAGGSAVGYMRDLCAAAKHMTQPTTAAKPLVNQVSGKWALQFDGVNDFLSTVSLPAVAAETMIVAGQFTRLDATQQGMMWKRSGNNGLFIRRETNSSVSGVVMTGAGFGGAILQNSDYTNQKIYALRAANGACSGRLNGAQVWANSQAFVSAATPLQIGAETGATLPMQGDIYATAYAPVSLTDAQCLLVERYLASLSGVTIA